MQTDDFRDADTILAEALLNLDRMQPEAAKESSGGCSDLNFRDVLLITSAHVA
ncbi:MAG: hypothetical protein RIB84_29505 [Sneathiellaceae bacterium]